MKIFFLEKSKAFTGENLDDNTIGGTEKILINITNELAKNDNFEIKVFNETIEKKEIGNVEWYNINNYDNKIIPDVLIAFSDISLFNNFKASKKFLWSHSVQSFEKFIRKKQFLPYIKHKPTLILEGDYHYRNRSYLTSFFGKKILKVAPDYDFINEQIDLNHIPNKTCIFTTKSDRNLNILIDTWKKIFKLNNDAHLMINPPYQISEDIADKNVSLRIKGSKKDLIKDLKTSKIMLVPGHKGEVFCLAAEEARELCIPIVTLGYGSLYERVEHNKTGFIAKNTEEFIDYTNRLLNDDVLYLRFRKNLFQLRNSRNYSHVVNDLLKIINSTS